MQVVLIPCVGTDWLEKGRLLGRVELAPGPASDAECAHWAEQLAGTPLKQIQHGPDELSKTTARSLGRKLVVPTKAAEDLAEVDLGLWAGLTCDELKSRYATAHRELCEAPLNVSPPGGEDLAEADSRIKFFLAKQLRTNGKAGGIAFVLRPLAFALAQCTLEGLDTSEAWRRLRHVREPVIIPEPHPPAARDGKPQESPDARRAAE